MNGEAMSGAQIAEELASGGAYTAWFIVVALSAVVAFMYREIQKTHDKIIEAYKDEDGRILDSTTGIIKTQMETTATLTAILRILEGRK